MLCQLLSLTPALGPIFGGTPVSLTLLAANQEAFAVSLNGSVFDSQPVFGRQSGQVVITTWTPPVSSPASYEVTVSPCIGSALFTFYDPRELNLTCPTAVIGSLGGTSLEIFVSPLNDSGNATAMWLSLLPSTLFVSLLSNTSTNTSQALTFDPLLPGRYSCTAADLVVGMPVNESLKVLVSLNGVDFHLLDSRVVIEERQPVRVLFMYNSVVDDHGWTNAHNNAKLRAASYFSIALSVDFAVVPDIYDGPYIQSYANTGSYDVIFVCTDFREDVIVPIAQQFPGVTFVLVSDGALENDPPASPNLIYTTALLNEAIYLTGVVAGNMIPQGGLVCFIKGFDVSSVQQGLNAFAIGLFKYNPSARLLTTTINSWTNLFLEQQAAERFYDMGCDLLSHQTSHAQTMEPFTSNGRYGIGVYSQSRSLLGENVLTSGVFNWTPGHIQLLQYALDGTLRNRSLVKGWADGAEYASALSGKVPYSVRSIYERERAELKEVFCGPIYDNNNGGSLRFPPGYCATNQDLFNMTWTLKGIQSLGTFDPIPPGFNDSRLDSRLTAAYFMLVGIFYIIAVAIAYFIHIHKQHAVFKFAQPHFLYVVLLGCCAGMAAIFPLAVDAHISSDLAYQEGSNLVNLRFPFADHGVAISDFGFCTHLCCSLQHSTVADHDRLWTRRASFSCEVPQTTHHA